MQYTDLSLLGVVHLVSMFCYLLSRWEKFQTGQELLKPLTVLQRSEWCLPRYQCLLKMLISDIPVIIILTNHTISSCIKLPWNIVLVFSGIMGKDQIKNLKSYTKVVNDEGSLKIKFSQDEIVIFLRKVVSFTNSLKILVWLLVAFSISCRVIEALSMLKIDYLFVWCSQ